MDEKDKAILEQLWQDSSQTTSDISEQTNIPITTVHNRIKKMEDRGVITGYTVEVDHKELGKGIAAYILVTVMYTLPDGEQVQQEDVAKQLSQLDEVETLDIITGSYDLVLKVRVGEVDELNDFVISKLRNIKGVDKTQTMVSLDSH
jgi:Lrp/AsnC family transcriptional regulator for asnA, asnC and gidA